MANPDVVRMEGFQPESSQDAVTDEHGNAVNAKKDDESSINDDLGGESEIPEEWKGMPEKNYARFKTVNDEVKELRGKLEKIEEVGGADGRDATTFRELMADKDFVKVLGGFIQTRGEGSKKDAPTLDGISFEGKTDSDVAKMIADYASHQMGSDLTGQIQKLTQLVTDLTGKVQDGDVRSNLGNEEKFPGAAKYKVEIKKAMTDYNIPFEKAYFLALGPNAQKEAYQQGVNKRSKKEKKDVHILSRGNKGTKQPEKLYKSVMEAMKAAKAEHAMADDDDD